MIIKIILGILLGAFLIFLTLLTVYGILAFIPMIKDAIEDVKFAIHRDDEE